MKFIAVIAIICAWSMSAQAQGLFGDPGESTSLYQDRKPRRASKIGDILTVLITETTSATNRADTDTKKENTTNITSGEGTGPLSFIPGFGLSSTGTTEYKGQGSTTRSQQIQARVSVTVVGLKPNGDLIVEGNRVIDINGEREAVHLSGAINPKIIPATNTIESFRISDLQVSYKGKGVIQEGTRPGILVRVMNWIF